MGYYMAGGDYTVTSQGSGGSTYTESGTIDDGWVSPVRRMNKFNGRALTRAMRRAKGFERMARKAVAFTRRVHFIKRKRG